MTTWIANGKASGAGSKRGCVVQWVDARRIECQAARANMHPDTRILAPPSMHSTCQWFRAVPGPTPGVEPADKMDEEEPS